MGQPVNYNAPYPEKEVMSMEREILNAAQREAVSATEGFVRVIAGRARARPGR